MIFSKMIPELTVFDIEKTKAFYRDILGFQMEYERPEDKDVYKRQVDLVTLSEVLKAAGHLDRIKARGIFAGYQERNPY